MKISRSVRFSLVCFLLALYPIGAFAQTKGLQAIKADEMKTHLRFLGAREFQGRNTPSVEQDIAAKYIALTAERYGLPPLMPNGSFYQEIPIEVTAPAPWATFARMTSGTTENRFLFPKDFGTRAGSGASAWGEVVFAGYGLSAPNLNWDDYGNLDLKGKVVVMLEVQLPQNHILKPNENRALLSARSRTARAKGAVAVVTVITRERENTLTQKGLSFDVVEQLRWLDMPADTLARPMAPPTGQPAAAQILQIEMRHDAAARLLGISRSELGRMYDMISDGKQVPAKQLAGTTLEIPVGVEARKAKAYNVVGCVEGSDPNLKSEYVVIGGHFDHNPVREGRIYPGADDNASGSVAMFEIARALLIERPKRSVIFTWYTGEEKGLRGAYYFISHSPVPVEKISAMLNLDMVSRNDPNSIYLIGTNRISMELDKSINTMNDRYVHMKMDYKYEDPGHPDRFFFRSDQYPYIRYGIPGVWFFCGTTEDYHQESDVEEKADYGKMEKVAKLIYATAVEIGNKPELLKLDVNPEITTRGAHNMKIDWQRALRERQQQQQRPPRN